MKKTITEKIMNVWKDCSVGVAILAIIGIIISTLILGFGLISLEAWIVMLLWNWIAVDLFSAPVLSFWSAFGLCWFCYLLFKNKTTINKKSK